MATINLTKDDFETTLKDNDIVIVDFWADWCGPCKSFAPTYETASEKHTDVVFGKVDTEDQRELAGSFGIRSIPTLMIFRDDVILFNQPGALPPAALEDVISQVKALDMEQVHREIAEEMAKESGEEHDHDHEHSH